VITVIDNGVLFTPESAGQQSVVALNGTIAAVGTVDLTALEKTGIPIERIDADGLLVIPGLIDPHEHLIGGSGERGFATQTPEIFLSELLVAGITTVVGCLGVDSTTKTMPALVAKVKGLNEEGLSAMLYSGGYAAPPATLMGTLREDILFVQEIIGAGETAIADIRGSQPSVQQLAQLVVDAHAGGILTGKAGITHFHVGPGRDGLRMLHELLDGFDIAPECLYPTHCNRTERLVSEAVELTRRGVTVDFDVVDGDAPAWLERFTGNGGSLDHLTLSTDAGITAPASLLEQLRGCVQSKKWSLEQLLRLVTTNTARVLKLRNKGRIAVGADADIVTLRRDDLSIADVVARGRRLVADGRPASPKFLDGSSRHIELRGSRAKRI
jgi:beta-aspartyl-dipeptidase (metallo-type)